MLHLHRASSALPAAGAFDASPAFVPITKVTTTDQIGIVLNYTADPGATSGYPGFRVAWEFPVDANSTSATVYETVDLATVTPDAQDGPVRQLRYRAECEDLTDASDEWTIRTIFVREGARAIRIEAAEVGDTVNPGTLAVYFSRSI